MISFSFFLVATLKIVSRKCPTPHSVWASFCAFLSFSVSFFFIYGSLIKSNTTLEAQGNRKRTAATDVVVSHRRSRQQVERPHEKRTGTRDTLTRSTSQNLSVCVGWCKSVDVANSRIASAATKIVAIAFFETIRIHWPLPSLSLYRRNRREKCRLEECRTTLKASTAFISF